MKTKPNTLPSIAQVLASLDVQISALRNARDLLLEKKNTRKKTDRRPQRPGKISLVVSNPEREKTA